MIYTTYNPSNGQILNVITLSDNDPNNPNLVGKSFVEGNYDARTYYINDGQPVEKPVNPSNAVAKYDFDYVAKSWVLNSDKSNQAARDIRTLLLSDVDKVNPIWYASLTQSQQQELQTYRQSLLDITDQPGFPTDIVWPTKPTFL